MPGHRRSARIRRAQRHPVRALQPLNLSAAGHFERAREALVKRAPVEVDCNCVGGESASRGERWLGVTVLELRRLENSPKAHHTDYRPVRVYRTGRIPSIEMLGLDHFGNRTGW